MFTANTTANSTAHNYDQFPVLLIVYIPKHMIREVIKDL